MLVESCVLTQANPITLALLFRKGDEPEGGYNFQEMVTPGMTELSP